MTGPDGLEWEDADYLYYIVDNGCPVCGAEIGAQCSYPDPDQSGFGIEIGLYVHSDRLEYDGPVLSDAPEVG